ncbi:MAG TPA: zinc ribbon domain-containing protein [Patescibacteria group bacterium]|nr:zinc ribbon domain-containing protein [Patescibacteria group bacterium]
MDERPKCQSCGRLLEVGIYGTNTDESPSSDYCKFCFENGDFLEPNISQEDMMGRMAANLIDNEGMDRDQAEKQAREIISTLKRWNPSASSGQATDN